VLVIFGSQPLLSIRCVLRLSEPMGPNREREQMIEWQILHACCAILPAMAQENALFLGSGSRFLRLCARRKTRPVRFPRRQWRPKA